MKVIHASTYEKSGGAATAAHRLHSGLRESGVDSRMAVLKQSSKDPHVMAVPMNRLQRSIRRRRLHLETPSPRQYPDYDGSPWSVGRISTPLPAFVNQKSPDTVHLHWVGHGFLSVKALAEIKAPLVWTLHDMWPFTGGCHYAGDCLKYQQSCGACPQLGSLTENDLSRGTWTQKHRHWRDMKLTLVAPSRWLAECVKASSLLKDFPLEVIPNGLDLTVFRPFDKAFARDVLNLPQDKKLVLFGADRVDDARKGLTHLINALQMFQAAEVELVTFGVGEPPPLNLKTHHAGLIQDERILSLLYSAVDVFVAPSVQDNLPNTVMEALACGTPTAAFNIGGMPDMIDHQHNGYLAQPFDAADLAYGIRWMLEDADRYKRLAVQARESTQRFALDKIAADYLTLYERVART